MRYSLLLAEDGGVLDDMMITAVPMGLYVVVNGAVKWDDMGYLREHLPDEITINHMDDRALLALQGPKAAEALLRRAGEVNVSLNGEQMTQRRIRHLPVVDGGRLVGFVSIGDLVKYRIDRIEAEAAAIRRGGRAGAPAAR